MAQELRERIDNWDYMKWQSLCTAREMVTKLKRTTHWVAQMSTPSLPRSGKEHGVSVWPWIFWISIDFWTKSRVLCTWGFKSSGIEHACQKAAPRDLRAHAQLTQALVESCCEGQLIPLLPPLYPTHPSPHFYPCHCSWGKKSHHSVALAKVTKWEDREGCWQLALTVMCWDQEYGWKASKIGSSHQKTQPNRVSCVALKCNTNNGTNTHSCAVTQPACIACQVSHIWCWIFLQLSECQSSSENGDVHVFPDFWFGASEVLKDDMDYFCFIISTKLWPSRGASLNSEIS
jgi:hypothetical protein